MMVAMSAGQRRSLVFGAALAAATLAAPAPSPAAGDGPIADPKIWCGDVAQFIANKDTEKFIDSFVFGSGYLVDRPSVAQAFAALAPALTQEGTGLPPEFLLEKNYGETFSRVWFLVAFEKGFLFLRCEGVKRGKGWIINSVTYDSTSSNVALP